MWQMIRVQIAMVLAASIVTSACAQEADTLVPVKTDFLGDPLPPHALLRLGTNRFNPSTCSAISLSADGRVVVSLNSESIMGWDAGNGQLLWTKPNGENRGMGQSGAAYGYRGLCRLPVSKLLASANSVGSINLLDYETGELTQIKTDSKDLFTSIDVSPDESLIAAGCGQHLLVLDRQGVEKFRVENQPKVPVRKRARNDRLTFGGDFSYARFSPDGKTMALVNSEYPTTLQILEAATGVVQKKIDTKGYVIRFCFSLDSQIIFATEQEIAARAYDVNSGSEIWERLFAMPALFDERYTTEIAISPAGNELAVGTAIGVDQRIHLLDPANGNTVGELEGHTWKPWCLEYNADGSQMYSAGWDGVIRRWDIEKREQIRVENSERASSVCSMAPDGKSIAFCDDSGKLHIVDISTGQKLRTIHLPGTTFSQVIYSQDCQRLAAGGSSAGDIHVYVWNLATGDELHHWNWPKGRDVHSSVEALSFSKNAERLAAAVFRQSACFVFDLPTNKQIAKTRHREVYGLSMRADGQQFVSAGWDSKIILWDCETGEKLKEHTIDDNNNANDPRMYGALYSPDGQSIAVLRMDETIGIYSLDLELVRNIPMNDRVGYGSFQFSHNGLWLGVGHGSGVGNIYDVYSGEVLWQEAKHDKYIYNVDFSPDDRSMLTGGEDGVCYLWDLNTANQGKPAEFDQLARDLVADSPQEAFTAHQQLVTDPKKAVASIRTAIEPLFSRREVPEKSEVEKLLGELDSGDESIRNSAATDLARLGPMAYSPISVVADDENVSEAKIETLKQLLSQIDDTHQGIRRAAMLLAQTETAEAGELLDELLESSPNVVVKKMIFLARKHREQYLQRIGHPAEK